MAFLRCEYFYYVIVEFIQLSSYIAGFTFAMLDSSGAILGDGAFMEMHPLQILFELYFMHFISFGSSNSYHDCSSSSTFLFCFLIQLVFRCAIVVFNVWRVCCCCHQFFFFGKRL